MIPRIVRVCVTAALGLAIADTAAAQASRFEVSGGYQTTRVADQGLPFGWSADVATNLNGTWSVVGEVSGAYRIEEDQDLGVDVRISVHSLGAGARWSSRVASRIIPFLQVLGGAARAAASARLFDKDVGDTSMNFMLQPGGGVNLKMTETLGLVGQVDYRRVFAEDEEDRASGANQFRVFVGARVGL
jgi:hypothetical protein